MNTLLLAVLLAASGDPLVAWTPADVQLSSDQSTTLETLFTARWSSLSYADTAVIDCQATTECGWACDARWNQTRSGAQIRTQLLTEGKWVPGIVAGTRLKNGNDKCWSRPGAWKDLPKILWPELGNQDPLRLTYSRIAGIGPWVAHLTYAKAMSAGDCAAASAQNLELIGVAP